jgi:uncharacterized repeat protein (TIGR03803 family)
LVQGADGGLYGATLEGGANDDGTLFEVTPNGTLTTLYNFCSQRGCSDGESPYGGLVQATDGNFYGTTTAGGANPTCTASNCGTVFRISPSGALTVLYSFCSQSNCTDGTTPYAGLVQATDGSFYGTTYAGGANDLGTVFKITSSGVLTTLYSFCSQSACTDGSGPEAGLVQATDGNFYGTTIAGGTHDVVCGGGCGTVFKITPSGMLTTLYSFCSQSGCADGDGPYAALVQGTDGNFYGVTIRGGDNAVYNAGTVFKITPSGTLTTLYIFCSKSSSRSSCADGTGPSAALFLDTNGNFYGTTSGGGTSNVGTVFSLSVGLSPFVETEPTSGKVGKTIRILGTNLTGATSVDFNDTAAAFTVDSKSFITATVPTGASTGSVTVTTPSRTLKSNKRFIVTP